MRWLIWLQHRFDLLCVAGALGLCGALLTFEHLALAASYAQRGLAQCQSTASPTCQSGLQAFANEFGNVNVSLYVLVLLPAVVGMFIGAPLVAREIEQGTFRFVWVQGATRTAWFGAKVLVLALVCMIAAAILTAIVSWGLAPLVRVEGLLLLPSLNPLTPPLFDLSGVVLVATTLRALSMGILAGSLTRTTIPAMLLTLVAFAAVQVPLDLSLAHLQPPVIASTRVEGHSDVPPVPAGSWVVRMGFMDAQGRTYQMLDEAAVPCRPHAGSSAAFTRCLHDLGLRSFAAYQPPERFWSFQGVVSATQGALALLTLAASWWIVRRRIA